MTDLTVVRRRVPGLALAPEGWKTAYLALVVAGGVSAVLASVQELATGDHGLGWLLVAGLTILGGFTTLRLPTIPVSFSISDSFTITAALLFGPAAGAVAVAIDGLVISLRLARRNVGVQRVLFNATAPALAMWLAAHQFFALAGVGPLVDADAPVGSLLLPLVVFAGLYFLINTGFIAGAIALERRTDVLAIWRDHFLPLWLTYFGGAAVALLFAVMHSRAHDVVVLALIATVPLILYAAFRNAVGRMEDQFSHLGQVNRLYLSTIEALATAIEAKDGVTHDHIRRVQIYAVGLAKALDERDEATIKAIEVAALLHDTGKIAVPEYILNKPGKLTPSEFEKMKRHVDVGADILSAVDFPYPVVPIVRCHHENWDGTGYPHGLAGEAIPIGARILSVVDCFDALTSDRPYRRALSEESAIGILLERRGTMYDPRVVDTFLRIHRELAPPQEAPAPARAASVTPFAPPRREPEPAAAAPLDTRLTALASLERLAADGGEPQDALVLAAALVRGLVPEATCVLYAATPLDELAVAHADGPLAFALPGLRMPVNQGLSGWVAAHRQTIVNSDAALDLADLDLPPAARACLSVPLVDGDVVVGVVTLYAEAPVPLTDAHAAALQTAAPRLARLLARAAADQSAAGTNRCARRLVTISAV